MPPEVTIRSARARRLAQRRPRRRQVVADDAEVVHLAAEAAQQRRQQEAVRVVDGARRERLAGHRQFVAGEEAGDPQPAEDLQRSRAPTDAASPIACGVSRVPGSRIVAPAAMSSPRRRIHSPGAGTVAEAHLRAAADLLQLCLLLHHHRIGAGGQRPRR